MANDHLQRLSEELTRAAERVALAVDALGTDPDVVLAFGEAIIEAHEAATELLTIFGTALVTVASTIESRES